MYAVVFQKPSRYIFFKINGNINSFDDFHSIIGTLNFYLSIPKLCSAGLRLKFLIDDKRDKKHKLDLIRKMVNN